MCHVVTLILLVLSLLQPLAVAQDMGSHPAPEKLGKLSFPTSCSPAVQAEFERGVALLHSFAYASAENVFQDVAKKDRHCAIAHWGTAMTYFHELWDPPLRSETFARGQQEIARAQQIGGASDRERRFIGALALLYAPSGLAAYKDNLQHYVEAMRALATANPSDVESQVFYALALLSNASPADKTHAMQKRALAVLEPLYLKCPQHPGLTHYIIHACDNAEMANQGLPAAQAYAKVAPSAPHALHMPSHIFTRLGMWDESIASNLAAEAAARQQGDTGEQLHAMDYLVYAYLQTGRDDEAAGVIRQLQAMELPQGNDSKIGYAAAAMPVRYAVERKQWAAAAKIVPAPPTSPPQVIAIGVWGRGLGLAHTGHPVEARAEAATLQKLVQQLEASKIDYWAHQVDVQRLEVLAWSSQAEGKLQEAIALLRQAADTEDAVEKLPVTPGPIVPAREQLGDLLLQSNQPGPALAEFQTALQNAPGRRGATLGAAHATELVAAQAKPK